MKGACGVSKWDRESNESVYEKFDMGGHYSRHGGLRSDEMVRTCNEDERG